MKSFDFGKKKEDSLMMFSSYNALLKGSLITLTFMIFGIVVIGGLTRLMGAGLSIVEWKPITGILPPLSLQEWILEFQKYQHSPEFQKINIAMTFEEFQSIFWLEYIHRLWGRLLGFILLIPTGLIIFKKEYRHLWPFLVLLWLLGLIQGTIGWLMVKSGLIQDPHVSPYRLAIHLFLGFMIFGVALWMTLTLYQKTLHLERKGYSRKAFQSLQKLSLLALILVLLTAFWGALVAGLKAGLLYNTFPLMGNALIPYELLRQTPWWKDLLENPTSVQFIHRLLAFITTFVCGGIWVYQQGLFIPKRLSHAFAGIGFISLLQFSFGIATLLLGVPIPLAILHQAFAFILFGSIIFALFLLKAKEYPSP